MISAQANNLTERVVVFGAGGFVGRSVSRAFLMSGRAVLSVERCGKLSCDVAMPCDLIRFLNDYRPSTIVNCAVVADFGSNCLKNLYAVNSLAPGVMAGWAVSNAGHLVQVSGTIVHGARTADIGPDTPVMPDTDYGRSKWIAEELVRASGADALTLRVGGIVGIEGPDHLSYNRILRDAQRGVAPCVVGRGVGIRTYVHVDDVAQTIVDAAARRLTGVGWLGGGEHLSIYELMGIACEVWLPGAVPKTVAGDETSDQIVATSAGLRPPLKLRDSLQNEKIRLDTEFSA